jgi:hypothetical protein
VDRPSSSARLRRAVMGSLHSAGSFALFLSAHPQEAQGVVPNSLSGSDHLVRVSTLRI